jgi:formamidopyrimidine-DNA glycosylase
MPELPEAETIVRGLRAPLEGRTLVSVSVRHADVLDEPPELFASRLLGAPTPVSGPSAPERPARVLRVERRGKNVIVHLAHNEAATSGHVLVVNLGMSGRLLWRPDDDPSPPPTHPAVHFRVSGEPAGTLVYHDPRRFGRIQCLSRADFDAWSRTLGPEPLDPAFTPDDLARELTRSTSPIRSWLLDQRRIAGVGNIYASEACHRAGIHPQTPARAIDAPSAHRLHAALVTVLEAAVSRGGTTLRDYRTAQGWEGAYQHSLLAYGRAGHPCATCETPIQRVVFSNRSAFFCPTCQGSEPVHPRRLPLPPRPTPPYTS